MRERIRQGFVGVDIRGWEGSRSPGEEGASGWFKGSRPQIQWEEREDVRMMLWEARSSSGRLHYGRYGGWCLDKRLGRPRLYFLRINVQCLPLCLRSLHFSKFLGNFLTWSSWGCIIFSVQDLPLILPKPIMISLIIPFSLPDEFLPGCSSRLRKEPTYHR